LAARHLEKVAASPIHGTDKRSEMTSLLETIVKVFPFSLLLLAFLDFGWRAFAIRFGICVGDTDVKDAIGPSSPETANQ
jgi:hypothetical protein